MKLKKIHQISMSEEQLMDTPKECIICNLPSPTRSKTKAS